MIDLNIIREEPERVKKAARDKNVEVDIDRLLELDESLRGMRGKVDEIERERNELAKAVGPSTSSGQARPSEEAIAKGKELKQQLNDIEGELAEVEAEFTRLYEAVPNLPSEDTPIGKDESENEVLREIGEKPSFDFEPKEHFELGEALGVIDSEKAAEVSGSRFAYLKGGLVHLEFALVQQALSLLSDEQKLSEIAAGAGLDVTTKPFVPVVPPVLIKPEVFQKMARLEPEEDRYHTAKDNLYLVGSAEHTMGPMHMGETISEKDLPLRYVGFSTAFRREAGSYGKDVRGILRVHQFDKLEIESFTTPDTSIIEQDFIVAIQEHIMQSLGLPYQVVLKCTGDMGTPNARAIDIETWMPGQDRYRETHTSDMMMDYQARRLATKVKLEDGSKAFVHMNDATVFAIGRTLIAIMENFQQADGTIAVPEVLKPYVPFEVIS